VFLPKLLTCLRDGYSWKQFRIDSASGVVVGLVALPLAMAFAIASGLPPERGLFTAVIAGFLISALGGSRVQIGGPTGAFVVIVSGIVAAHGYNGLVLATLMAGVILVIMGISRLGTMIQYIPYPVVTGFTSGIAVIIFSSQIPDFFGLKLAPHPAGAIADWKACFDAASTVNPWAMSLAAFTALLIWNWPKGWSKIPAALVALILTSLAASGFSLPVETIGSRFGSIPNHLPHPAIPDWSWSQIQQLIPSATTIAILAAIESLLSAVVADGMIGGRHRSNTELIAQGIANIASPLFGGMPATGAIARTATNVRNGGRTPVAGIVHALVILLILLTAAPLAAKVPMAALAGILVIVSIHMAEFGSFRFILSGPGSDLAVLLTTFALTVLVDLTVAVEVGIVLAALLFMKQMADLTHVTPVESENGKGDTLRRVPIPPGVQVFTIRGSFFFGAAQKIMEVGRIVSKAPKALILDMAGVLHMDASGLHVLEKIQRECTARGTRLILAGAHSQPLLVLTEAGQVERFGEENFKGTLEAALAEFREKGL